MPQLDELIRGARLLAKMLDDPPPDRVYMGAAHLRPVDQHVQYEFTVGRMYKSVDDPAVMAMIRQVMDAIFAKFPDLKAHPAKIVANRKGESTLELAAIRFGMMTSEGDPVDEDELDEEDED